MSNFSLASLLHAPKQTPHDLDPALFHGPDAIKLDITASIVIFNGLVASVFGGFIFFAANTLFNIQSGPITVMSGVILAILCYRQFTQNCLDDAFDLAIEKRDAATTEWVYKLESIL